MTGVGRARRVGALAAAVILGATLLPLPARGAGDAVQTLPGASLNALMIDLDGDGANEVLRLVDRERPGMDLEVWGVRDGTWWKRASIEVASHPGPDGSLDPSSEIATLLRWHRDGRDRAMLATASMLLVPNAPSTVCCVELAEVVLARGVLMLDPVPTDDLRAEFLMAIDMDADGTDELVTQATAYHDMNDTGTFRLEVHRWDGDGFRRFHADERDDPGFGVIPGEGDGQPGTELYVTSSTSGVIQRLVLVDGVISDEAAGADLGQPFDAWILGAANGRVLVQYPEGVRLFDWPRDQRPIEIGEFRTLTYPRVDLVGGGRDALFVVYEGFDYLGANEPRLTVLDVDFNQIGSIPMSERMAPLWDAARTMSDRGYGTGRYLFPFVGLLPGPGPRESWSYLVNGVRVEADGAGGYAIADASPLVGVTPIGRGGPDDAWLALGQSINGFFGPFGVADNAAYLFPYTAADFGLAGALTLALADEALAPTDEPIATFLPDGAVAIESDGKARLAAPYDGFEMLIDAPARSIVTYDDGTVPVDLDVGEVPLVVHVRAPNGPKDRNRDFTRTFVVTTPDGRATVVTWEGTFIGEPPEVTAFADTDAFALHSRVHGRVSDGASVTVDGRPAQIDANGDYSVQVDAPAWPRDVVVIARDPLGNEATQRLEVVGFLDYRGLPWAALIGLATVAAGAFLFVRTPQRRARPLPSWDDGMLEEVDGDLG